MADCKGWSEARRLFSGMMGAPPEQVVVANNSSLALMHDTVVFALLKGTCDSATPWSKQGEIAFLCPVPGYDRHFTICKDYGIRMIPVALKEDGPDMDRGRAAGGAGRIHQGHVVRSQVQQSHRHSLFGRGDRAPGGDEDRGARTSGSIGTTPTACIT